ncbi:glyceraldehyde-3-phosphate dehydrogenase [Magnetofaba australis]|uniref:Putative glyceraldehyde 3-phosphate dehydrogenase n=1 Tax=Magnetofaba australis IT-1 TaxID=1434232 RepID=A0A1Y2K667_9PROT|nr:glyceraldehyde-3-phosphate dehydrogenase [Magnetofaba australis]OSM02505.1 putative glyceraldehyde 3-phosphate dehydrogenase [Magnetofaba australis IT-1]
MSTLTGMNGFGRFGLHLLKYWLDRSEHANFKIAWINDDKLTLEQALKIIEDEIYVPINKYYKISVRENEITFTSADGVKNSIIYTTAPRHEIPWIGEPEIFLECSGKNTLRKDCQPFLTGNTRLVNVSATSWDCDKTVIYGFNHVEPLDGAKVISYGSCTVNAFTPLAQFVHDKWGVLDADVNVIHNIQHYKLGDPKYDTLLRKFCTLEKQGPMLLPFLNPERFLVNYTVVPYAGVSVIDFRFRIERPQSIDAILHELEHGFGDEGPLAHMYGLDETDRGPEVHKCTPYSSVFSRDQARILGDNLYLRGYFDNENSVNRYYDLTNYLSADNA